MAEDSVWLHRFGHFSAFTELAQGVSGRPGGVSEGQYWSLNIGLGSDDDPEAISENRRRLAGALGIAADRFVRPYQVHGAEALVVGREEVEAGLPGPADVPRRVDVLLTAEPDVFLMMTFADCVPVLFYDPARRVVGLVHAGWRGTIAGAPRRALDLLQKRFGSRLRDVLVGIGPSIGPDHYEVGPEVAAAARAAFPACEGLLRPGPRGREHLDLWRANTYQLVVAGLPPENLEVAGLCTACRNDLLFSYRASQGRTGFHAAVIGLRA
ncbi:MAG: peptidoglycan editing factor PgeF [Chloroflexi bacterium]|nr:peptidoglycan editing factor PgeF [Chloroflexota bacterium]